MPAKFATKPIQSRTRDKLQRCAPPGLTVVQKPEGYYVTGHVGRRQLTMVRLGVKFRDARESLRHLTGWDVTAITAARLFNTDPGAVTEEQRRLARSVNFSKAYKS